MDNAYKTGPGYPTAYEYACADNYNVRATATNGAKGSAVRVDHAVPFGQTLAAYVTVEKQSSEMTKGQIARKAWTTQGRGDLAVEDKRLSEDIAACHAFQGRSEKINEAVAQERRRLEEQQIRVQRALNKGK